jgi:hypothetical protein
MKIQKLTLDYLDQKTNALIFLPEISGEFASINPVVATFAIFTHGYTSDKSSILNWAIRLSESGVSCLLFDLPGHYQGNYSEVEDFDHFKNHAHELFVSAFIKLKASFLEEFPLYEHMLEENVMKLVLGGHSLGAMLSLKALMLPEFANIEKCAIAVGLGLAPKNIVHIFDTPFYKSTLRVREQLVSPALNSENVFPWIKDEKKLIAVEGQIIHLITGVDDLVVGEDGMERFAEVLDEKNNTVFIEKPNRLPHHEPQLAAPHVKKILKKINWL